MMFPTGLSREYLEEKLSSLQNKKYNRFMWWRRYQTREDLQDKAPLINKIKHGDYEVSDYYYQAEHENYLLEDAVKDIKHYEDKIEKIALFRTRYKKLHEDFVKEEADIMKRMKKDFKTTFKISQEELESIMENFDGTVLELYEHLKNVKGEDS